MAMYESDHTKFMREWMEKHPEQRDEQKKGRALWWDKPQSVEEQKRVALDTIADVDASGLWPGEVVTEVTAAGPFWAATTPTLPDSLA